MHDQANITWVHKTIDALIELDEYSLLAPLRHTSDSEILAIIHKHTYEPLHSADVELRTNVINEIANLDWKRRMDTAIEEITEQQETREEYTYTNEDTVNKGRDTYGLRIHIVCKRESRPGFEHLRRANCEGL